MLPSARLAGRGKQLAAVAVAATLLLGISAQWRGPAAQAATPAPSPTATATSSPTVAPSPTPSPTPTTSSGPTLATLTGEVPAFTSTGQIGLSVYAMPPSGPTMTASGQAASPVRLAAAVVLPGQQEFSIAIPQSSTAMELAKEGNGNINLQLRVFNGTQLSITFTHIAVPVAAATPQAIAAQRAVPASAASGLNFPSPWTVPASAQALASGSAAVPQAQCLYSATPYNNVQTRIGELHVANDSWMNAIFTYQYNADSVVSVGASGGSSGPWSADGSVAITNSITSGAAGQDPQLGGSVTYVDDHMNYERVNQGICGFFVQATWSQGDAFAGTNSPPTNPMGNCHNAEANGWGFATIQHGDGINAGTYSVDSQQQVTSSLMTNDLFNYTFSGTTGWSTDASENWYDESTMTDTYVCGANSDLSKSSVIYNGNQ